jgi:hypothetical protein
VLDLNRLERGDRLACSGAKNGEESAGGMKRTILSVIEVLLGTAAYAAAGMALVGAG